MHELSGRPWAVGKFAILRIHLVRLAIACAHSVWPFWAAWAMLQIITLMKCKNVLYDLSVFKTLILLLWIMAPMLPSPNQMPKEWRCQHDEMQAETINPNILKSHLVRVVVDGVQDHGSFKNLSSVLTSSVLSSMWNLNSLYQNRLKSQYAWSKLQTMQLWRCYAHTIHNK